MNFIVNKIIYVFNHPWLIVFLLVVIEGMQISNLKKEVQGLKSDSFPVYISGRVSELKQEVQDIKSQINPTISQEVRLPSTTIVPIPSTNQISIPQSNQE
jgi:hypothetical protein